MTVDRSAFTRLRPRDDRGRLARRTREEYASAFWSRVSIDRDANACWRWSGPVDAKGYGEIARCAAMTERKAHRIAYALSVGPIPTGRVVMHSCDTPPCCNPAHLTVGTNLENTRDSMRKGRRAAPPTLKLTIEQVREIRSIGDRLTRTEIGKRFGISGRNVLSILRRESWRHVP